jgi:putative oxidoreductase
MKITTACVSRSLIALLFIVAGLQKLTHFQETVTSVKSLGIPLAGLAALIVIIIEVPVAAAFAWGYRTHITGGILILFTLIVTVAVHGNLSQGMNMVMALKNIAIIGGI